MPTKVSALVGIWQATRLPRSYRLVRFDRWTGRMLTPSLVVRLFARRTLRVEIGWAIPQCISSILHLVTLFRSWFKRRRISAGDLPQPSSWAKQNVNFCGLSCLPFNPDFESVRGKSRFEVGVSFCENFQQSFLQLDEKPRQSVRPKCLIWKRSNPKNALLNC